MRFESRISSIILSFSMLLFCFCGGQKTEQELFTEAQEKYGEDKYSEAIDIYEEVIETYPEGVRCADATFMIGFIYKNNLNDIVKAGEYYKRVVENFPTDTLAISAQFELDYIELSPGQLDSILQKRIEMQEEKKKKEETEK
ncbi:tol-pal system YbgF family protein [candidate division KSB1 bacterium]